MTFWEIFWTANDLLWPVYVALIALWLVSIAVIHFMEWKKSRNEVNKS